MRIGRCLILLGLMGALVLALVPTAFATPQGQNGQAKKAVTITSAPAWTPAEQALTPERDWINVGGNIQQQHYSALKEINAGNVASLKEAWHIHLDGSGQLAKYNNEATPLVYAGVMYIPTGNNDVFALDAQTGARLWTHLANEPQNMNTICCGWDARGLAIGEGKVFSAQLDGKLVALDQQTGSLVWSASNARWQDGYTMTMAPLYYRGLIIVGVSGSEYGARGSMTAYDAKTGHRVWRFYTVPTPGDIGSGTWPNNTEWQHGGATIWNTPTIDVNTGIMTFTTANADPWMSRGPGDNLFTATMVALDAMTGEYAWHYQIVHHDLWDYDCPSPTMMLDNVFNGKMQTAAIETCKTGWMYVINARDGNPLLQIDEKPVPQDATQNTAATQPTPVGDAFAEQCPVASEYPAQAPDNQPFVFGCIWTPPNERVFTVVAPGAGGGTNWSPNSYNPATGYVYTCSGNSRTALKAIPNASATYVGGRTFTGFQSAAQVAGTLSTGDFTALNVLNNKIAWKQHYIGQAFQANVQVLTGAACSGGSLSTAGNIVAVGQPAAIGAPSNHVLNVYNAQNGALLAKLKTDAAVQSPPMTYTINGKQYLAAYANGRINTVNPAIKGDSVYAWTLP
jgi:quinohemoprotein ethanol dehydrogenase